MILRAAFFVLATASALFGHEGEIQMPLNVDEIVVPRNIPLLQFVRFTRLDHHIVINRITERGDTHHIGTMTADLSLLAVQAGERAPRATAKLVWDMAQLSDWQARMDFLAETHTDLRVKRQEFQIELIEAGDTMTEPELGRLAQIKEDLAAVRALIAMIEHWQANPMNGAGS